MSTGGRLSIIIPVYNTEHYLKRCIDSLMNQSLPDIEIIIVNDASTDRSEAIIQSYLSNSNIKYVKLEKHTSLGNARNVGMKEANGEYIGFVDSDDWVDYNFYRLLLCFAIKNDIDIAIGGVKSEFENSSSSNIENHYDTEHIIRGDCALNMLCQAYNQDSAIHPSVWNKIYKKDLLWNKKLYFEENTYNEDDIFTYFSLIYAERVALISGTYYHWYQRHNSITHTFSKKHISDLIYAFSLIKEKSISEGIYDKYQQEYHSFFERCSLFLLESMFSIERNNVVQKRYLYYFVEKFMETMSLADFMEYFDVRRIRKMLRQEK